MTDPADSPSQAFSTTQLKSKKNGRKRSAKAEGDSGDKLLLSGKGGGNHTRPRGMDKDSPGVRLSKTLSWILRHGALSEGILIRSDGFVKVEDIVGITHSLLGQPIYVPLFCSFHLLAKESSHTNSRHYAGPIERRCSRQRETTIYVGS